ncbi:ADP-ribosylglycohydrolase family protein [Sporotomaculum syntrophicum]|nr:ADP-ribosylglycohydrolase family protein [Sporotomaculum syntrophicum]
MSMAIARLTHWDPEAGLTCFLYCLLVREILNGTRDKLQAWNNTKDKFLSHTARQFAGAAESLILIAFNDIEFWHIERLKPSGYTVDSLACALWCFFRSNSFEEAVINAVNLGNDADTIGAITGGLAGVYWGYMGIPERWLTKFSSYQVARLDNVANAFKKVKFVG